MAEQLASPDGLRAGGKALWSAITDAHELDAPQLVQLEEACRAKDRLDQLDKVLRGDADTWATVRFDQRADDYVLKIDAALVQANATANLMKQLIAALRLPDDVTGKKPQRRGAARGAVKPQVPGGSSAKDRLRAVPS